MKLPRRKFLHLAAGAAALPFGSRIARAQAYPSRPVRILVGFPAGGSTDIAARQLAQRLSERLGQPFIVDNRPGAGSNIAAEAVVRSRPDGYMLFMATPANAINTALYEKLNFNFVRDIVPVAAIIRSPFVLEVHPSVPVKTVPELIAYAKANPGKLNMASFGIGTGGHLSGELFKITTGIQMSHVPYRGSAPMLIDLISGQVQVAFDNLPASIEHIKAGKLRALAVSTTMRSEALPDVPTVAETLAGFESSAWSGVLAPKNTPTEIVDRLNREINAALGDPSIKAKFTELSGMIIGGSSDDFGKLIADETEKWAKVVKFSGAKPD